jgi:UDP-N-acetylmuramoyl-tripeptide--D-alanyl-D-alanine ligase
MSKGIQKIFTYGTQDADVVGHLSQSDPFLSVAFDKGFTGEIETNLVGAYNLPNVLAAVAVGKFFSLYDEKIREAIRAYNPTNSRSQLVHQGSNKIILDAYNANPSSMKVAIENFARIHGDNKVLVLGAMAELGTDSLQEHRSLVDEIGKNQWKEVLLVGGDFMHIEHPYQKLATAQEAGEWLRQQNLQGAYLLVKGSRSTGMEKVLDYLD